MSSSTPVSATRDAVTRAWEWRPSLQQGLLVALVLGLAFSISVSQLALASLAAWLLLARRAGRPVPLRAPLLGPIALFVAWSAVSALASARPLESLVAGKPLLNLVALFVIASALSEPALARRFTTWLLLALAAAAGAGLLQVALCPGADAIAPGTSIAEKFLRKCTRARGFYSIYMTLGGVLALAMTAALPRLARLRAETWWLAPAWLVSAAGLAVTYVRGAWLGLAAGVVAALLGLGRRGVAAAIALVLLAAALALGLPGVSARLRTIGSPSDDTTRDRLAMLEAGRRLAIAHPLTGIGPGQVKNRYPSVAPAEAMRHSTSHLHNTPLQILVERGVIGLALWLWIFVAFLVRGTARLRRLPATATGDRALVLGSLAAVVTFLFAGLFEYNFGDTEVLLVMLAFMAVPFALVGEPESAGS